jgi:hypothetical protein
MSGVQYSPGSDFQKEAGAEAHDGEVRARLIDYGSTPTQGYSLFGECLL